METLVFGLLKKIKCFLAKCPQKLGYDVRLNLLEWLEKYERPVSKEFNFLLQVMLFSLQLMKSNNY